MKIGSVEIKGRVFLAPMAGVSDICFRRLCHEHGCTLSYSEMISAKAMSFASEKTRRLAKCESLPSAIQIFGSDARLCAAAASALESEALFIDINMGCPAPKIVSNGDGCALMRDVYLAEKIVFETCAAVSKPVTVKMRLGYDEDSVNFLELGRAVQRAGAAAVTLHARTRSQFYSGRANLDAIAALREALTIPVIGNGDVASPLDAEKMLRVADAVMIGRAAMGNPWIFGRTEEYLATSLLPPEPSDEERIALAVRHVHMLCAEKGEYIGVRESRRHASYYIKGMKNSSRVREKINSAQTEREMAQILTTALI